MVSLEAFQALQQELLDFKASSNLYITQLQQQQQQVTAAAAAVTVDKEKYEAYLATGYLTDKKSFKLLKTYKGKVDEYEQWRFKFANFLKEEPYWEDVLKEAESWQSAPTDNDVAQLGRDKGWEMEEWHKRVSAMSKQLYNCLCAIVEEKAFATVKNLEHSDWSGLACWWKLAMECNANSTQRVQGLILKINAPKRVKKYSEVLAALDEWESNVKVYEGLRKVSIAEDMKVAAIRQIVPEDLDRDIYRDYTDRSYAETMSYIVKQVGIRRDLRTNGGSVPMDVDSLMSMDKDQALEVIKMIQNLQGAMNGGEHAHGQCGHGDYKCEENYVPEYQPQDQPETADGANPLLNALNSLNSMVKGKGDKGKGKGGVQGNCSHCGLFGHMKRNCRKLDAEMNAYRAQNGKGGGKGKGKGYQGRPENNWNNWNNKGGGGFGYQGGYRGYNPGKGGKGYAGGGMNYAGNAGDWNGYQGGDQQGEATWALSLKKVDSDYVPAKNTVKANMDPKKVQPPPGLNQFQVLQSDDVDSEIQNFMKMQNDDEHTYPLLKMENYSKRSIKAKNQPETMKPGELSATSPGYQTNKNTKNKHRNWRPLNLFEKATTAESAKILSPFIASKQDENGYTAVTSVMDSGASESVAPAAMCPGYPIRPSAGSLAGQKYLSASDDLIPNLGEQLLQVVTETGREGTVKYQIAEVSRPLTSVSEICDAGGPRGQQVVFGKNGGVIINVATGQETPFRRENGVYTLQMWVKPQPGFTRRG